MSSGRLRSVFFRTLSLATIVKPAIVTLSLIIFREDSLGFPVVRMGFDPDAKRRPSSYCVDGGLCLVALLVEDRRFGAIIR